MADVIIVADLPAAGAAAAALIATALSHKSDLVLGVATGSTPLPIWSALAALHLDLSRVSAFALDEYLGLPPGHTESYAAVVHREITVPLGLDPRRVHTPEAHADVQDAPAAYESAIRAAGGVDVQVLGIGRNGHIGFNEPGSSLSGRTHLANLSTQTRRDNSRFFESLDQVPTRCITQGVGTILEARRLILVASGRRKADAVAAALEGPVTASVPASALQLHPDVVAIVDEDAATGLSFADHYRLSARSGDAA
jgi:glucosamine-6-phosphate deaminase